MKFMDANLLEALGRTLFVCQCGFMQVGARARDLCFLSKQHDDDEEMSRCPNIKAGSLKLGKSCVRPQLQAAVGVRSDNHDSRDTNCDNPVP